MLRTTSLTLLTLACLALFATRVVYPALTGLTPVSIRTPSMAPTIPPGALVYVDRTHTPRIGDVVTFQTESGDLITHRLTGDWSGIGLGPWQTKGDANSAPDATLIPTSAILGTATSYLPILGTVNHLLSQPALIAFVLMASMTIVLWPALMARPTGEAA